MQSITISKSLNYTEMLQCEWVVRAPPGYHLGYKFVKIQLQSFALCHFDYIETYDGDSATPIKKYCMQNDTQEPESAVEVGSTLRVVLKASFRTNGRYFELQVDLDHGGLIEASNGLIDFGWNGSNWRWWIQKKMSHEWIVKVNHGRRVRAVFEEFDVAAGIDGTCKEKYVMVGLLLFLWVFLMYFCVILAKKRSSSGFAVFGNWKVLW